MQNEAWMAGRRKPHCVLSRNTGQPVLQRRGARFLADDRQPDYDRISGAVKCNHLTQSNRAAIQMYIQYEWDTGKQEGIRYPCPGNGFPLFFMPHNNRRP